MSIKIIGINHDMFISSAALIVDGKIECAIPEERLSREKMSRSFPHMAIDQCLKICGLKDVFFMRFRLLSNWKLHII